jgi:hypothetical protein
MIVLLIVVMVGIVGMVIMVGIDFSESDREFSRERGLAEWKKIWTESLKDWLCTTL